MRCNISGPSSPILCAASHDYSGEDAAFFLKTTGKKKPIQGVVGPTLSTRADTKTYPTASTGSDASQTSPIHDQK
jgi:hypothetical protein